MTTLREMIGTYRLSAHCDAYSPVCNHSSDLNLEMLVQRFGWDFDIVDHRQEFRRRLVCSKCGKREPNITISPVRVGGGYG